jgi:hypothetical protein
LFNPKKDNAHPFHHYYFPFQKVQIRLSGGRSKLDGRIEILPPGQSDWGVICVTASGYLDLLLLVTWIYCFLLLGFTASGYLDLLLPVTSFVSSNFSF